MPVLVSGPKLDRINQVGMKINGTSHKYFRGEITSQSGNFLIPQTLAKSE